MRKFLQKIFKTENINLTEVQEKIDKCNLNKNQLILSSCGSGKTEASFYIGSMWNKRLLYVYPMKTLASSIHKRLNNYENILKSNELWTIQHSSAMEDKFLNSKKCITTIDQVLAGYLGIGVQSFIKGKNVVCSNFIFDEIQLFEPGKTLKTTICMLDELVKRGNKFVEVIRLTTETLQGIPSIVYGLFGMLFFVNTCKWGFSILAGAFTLAIMVLPLIMRSTEEALKSVPDSYREGSFGLGAGKLRTVFRIVLPSAIPGILAGVILAIGRIVGETAALIYTAGTVAKVPKNVLSSGRTLAVHMYNLSSEGLYMNQAYATAVVLLVLVVVINTLSGMIAKRITKA